MNLFKSMMDAKHVALFYLMVPTNCFFPLWYIYYNYFTSDTPIFLIKFQKLSSVLPNAVFVEIRRMHRSGYDVGNIKVSIDPIPVTLLRISMDFSIAISSERTESLAFFINHCFHNFTVNKMVYTVNWDTRHFFFNKRIKTTVENGVTQLQTNSVDDL